MKGKTGKTLHEKCTICRKIVHLKKKICFWIFLQLFLMINVQEDEETTNQLKLALYIIVNVTNSIMGLSSSVLYDWNPWNTR